MSTCACDDWTLGAAVGDAPSPAARSACLGSAAAGLPVLATAPASFLVRCEETQRGFGDLLWLVQTAGWDHHSPCGTWNRASNMGNRGGLDTPLEWRLGVSGSRARQAGTAGQEGRSPSSPHGKAALAAARSAGAPWHRVRLASGRVPRVVLLPSPAPDCRRVGRDTVRAPSGWRPITRCCGHFLGRAGAVGDVQQQQRARRDGQAHREREAESPPGSESWGGRGHTPGSARPWACAGGTGCAGSQGLRVTSGLTQPSVQVTQRCLLRARGCRQCTKSKATSLLPRGSQQTGGGWAQHTRSGARPTQRRWNPHSLEQATWGPPGAPLQSQGRAAALRQPRGPSVPRTPGHCQPSRGWAQESLAV